MLITVLAYKGGVGKTTTAIHVAAYLSTHGSTLLVDGDLNRSALAWQRRGDGSLPFPVVDESQSEQVGNFTHSVIDTAARPSPADLKLLAAESDLIIVPTVPDAVALDALLTTVDDLKNLGENIPYRILITMAPPSPSRDGADAQSYLRGEGIPVFDTIIRRYSAYGKAGLEGVAVSEAPDPKARIAWSDYERLGKEILP